MKSKTDLLVIISQLFIIASGSTYLGINGLGKPLSYPWIGLLFVAVTLTLVLSAKVLREKQKEKTKN